MAASNKVGNPDEFIRRFQSKMSQLSDPILIEVLNPLVIDAQTFASSQPNGGQTIVGVIESQLLRAPSHQKYAISVFVDALIRARSTFPFKAQFALNLERIFSAAYFEADETAKTKMLRLINIWKKDKRFDPLILDRIRARCDPDYNGPPADSLPLPQPTPPPATLAHSMYGQPAQSAVRPPSIFDSMPVNPAMQPGFMVDQNLVFARAGELLNNMYASMGVAEHQRMPLVEIHRVNPVLYQQIMAQAHHETMMRMPGQPQYVPPVVPSQVPVSQPVVAPQSQPSTVVTPPPSTVTTTTTSSAATTTSDTSVAATAPPPNLSLSKMNAQNILDRQVVNFVLPSLVEHGMIGCGGTYQKTIKVGDNCVMVRTWFLRDEDWKRNLAHHAFKTAQLFETSLNSDEGKIQKSENSISDDSCVPKDPIQTHCALSGEEFETFWNEDEQMWMYKGAIRPDPAGPIYKVHAWLASQRKHAKTLADQALPELDDQHLRKKIHVDS